MRDAVVSEIERLAGLDDRICVMTADMGYGVWEPFAKNFPDRFFNVGICEQLMASASAGMALSGNIVITYSIGNFTTLRCIEQLRNDVCYHNANVKIIAVGGGFSYGQLGMTHHATEDIAMMRSLPNMKVFVPADPEEATALMGYALGIAGPCYIRLARKGEPILYTKKSDLHPTNIREAVPGKDVALMACGPLLQEIIEASKYLQDNNVSAAVFSVPCVKPIDKDTVQKLAKMYSLLISVEEHNIIGGLGSAIAEIIGDMKGERCRIHRLGLRDEYTSIVGDHDFLCERYGLSAELIVKDVMRML